MSDNLAETEVKLVSQETGEELRPKRNRKKLFTVLTVLGFLAVVGTQLFIRMIYLSDILYEIKVSDLVDHYFDAAYIKENGLIYTDYFSVSGLYLVILSCLFKLFGNVYQVIIYYDAFLELLALIFIFAGLRKIFGRAFAVIVSLIIAAYPAIMIEYSLYCNTMYILLWRDDRILYLAGAIAFMLLGLIVWAIKKSIKSRKEDGSTDDPTDNADASTQPGSATVKKQASESVKKAPEDYYEDPYPYGSQLKVVLSEDGMLVEEYKVVDPDGLIPPEVAAKLDAEENAQNAIIDVTDENVAPSLQESAASDLNESDTAETIDNDDEDTSGDGEVELLINPLPGPKKHEHKDIDYDYDIPESEMKFDLDIDENAQYDHE